MMARSTHVGAQWIRVGGIAGILYVLIAVVAGALTGAIPPADGRAATYQNYFVEKQDLLIVQAWLYPLAVPLLLMFSVAVRRILRRSDGHLSELFLTGQTAIAALLVVTMGMQIAVAQAAGTLDAQLVFTVGVHFGAVVIEMFGFITATAAFAYAFCVFKDEVLPRWTAYLAALASLVCVASTAAVFVRTGPFALEGGVPAFAPAVVTVLWYLGTSIAMLRTGGESATSVRRAEPERAGALP
jgi:hypothetical protein